MAKPVLAQHSGPLELTVPPSPRPRRPALQPGWVALGDRAPGEEAAGLTINSGRK